MGQIEHLILLAEHHSLPLAFRHVLVLVVLNIFCNFGVNLSECFAKIECLVVEMIANLFDLILALENEHVIWPAEHDFSGLPPSVKSNVFEFSTRFGRLGHFWDFWVTLSKCCA